VDWVIVLLQELALGHFALKISWDVARAFLTEAAWTVSQPDFLSGDNNQDVGGPFHHFGYFFIFIFHFFSFDEGISFAV
jgi:hypothetical protein